MSAACVFVLSALLCVPPRSAAAPALDSVRVPGLAASPNAFSPALPCTLVLIAPGDRLQADGVTLFGGPLAPPTAAGDFAYAPFGVDDYRFDQVNVLFHTQRFLERLQRYGLDLHEYPIYLSVARATGSGTHPTEPITYIGTGTDGRNADAKDSDIIIHEITHAVFNPRMSLEQYPGDKGESQPLAEGLADYFAAAVNGDTRMGEYSSPPDGYHDIRSDAAVYHYSRWDILPADPYARGRVMNGALLEIRSRIGETADELTFAAVETRPLRCMVCFADAVRWADAERFQGAHMALIDSAFARRGIGSGPPSHLAVIGPAWGWSTEPVQFRVRHRCGPGPFTVAWSFRTAAGERHSLPGSADSVSLIPSEDGFVEATLTDRFGAQYAVSSPALKVYPGDQPGLRLGTVEINGPRSMPPGSIGDYTFRLTGGAGVPPYQVRWRLENGVIMRGPETASSIRARSRGGAMRVVMTCTDALGQTATGSREVFQTALLASAVSGPAVLGRGQPGRFVAHVSGGLPPYVLMWRQSSFQREDTLSATPVVLSMPAGADYTLTLSVRDATGESIVQYVGVRVLPTVGEDAVAAHRVFRALGSRVPRGGELVLELPAGSGHATVEVLDLAGRVQARERLPAEAGARHTLRLPDSAAAGVYFARLITPIGTRVARFVVLGR